MRRPVDRNGRPFSCWWCKRQLESTTSMSSTRATRDHVFPECMGGKRKVWACHTCNNLKGAMLPAEWAVFMDKHPQWWQMFPRKPGPAPRYR